MEDNLSELFSDIFKRAKSNTSCLKLPVGAAYRYSKPNRDTEVESYDTLYSCNCGEHRCIDHGECYKAFITGIYESCEETRKYCQSTHAEINMINIMKSKGIDPSIGTLYVSRYPCVNCAKNIAEFGIKSVKYCGRQEISDEVKKIFDDNGISYEWFPKFDFEY